MTKQLVVLMAIILSVCFFSQSAMAGGIDNKQNFSARYVATLSRNAAVDGADIAAYNPAGIMQRNDGLVLEVDVQDLLKVYENRYTSEQDGHVMKDQDNPSYVPGLFGVFKKEDWGTFFSFTVNGGGGDVDYEQGNALTDTIERSAAIDRLDNEYFKADSFYLTYTMGGTYQFNNLISAAVGARYVDAEKNIDAYGVAAGGGLWAGPIVGAYKETAEGFGYIASLNLTPSEKLLFALKYESAVELEFKTEHESKTNGYGNALLSSATFDKPDGKETRRDLPAVWAAGVRWQAMDAMVLETSYTLYLEEHADWDSKVSNVDNSWEVGVSATIDITDALRFSLGYLFTDVGITPDDYSLVEKISPVLDAHSFSLGLGYDWSDKLALECGVMYNHYDSGDDATTSGGIEYSKYNIGVAVGAVWQF